MYRYYSTPRTWTSHLGTTHFMTTTRMHLHMALNLTSLFAFFLESWKLYCSYEKLKKISKCSRNMANLKTTRIYTYVCNVYLHVQYNVHILENQTANIKSNQWGPQTLLNHTLTSYPLCVTLLPSICVILLCEWASKLLDSSFLDSSNTLLLILYNFFWSMLGVYLKNPSSLRTIRWY